MFNIIKKIKEEVQKNLESLKVEDQNINCKSHIGNESFYILGFGKRVEK